MAERELMRARLERSIHLSERTKHLQFSVEGLDRFDFTAGQFVSIREPKPDGRLITRAYSIASPPRADSTFDLCLNRVEGGFMSNYLCDLKEGDEVHLHGPHGHFVLKQPANSSVFIATGTGIAPFRGMVHWLFADAARHQGRQFWLVYGTRYPDDIYYRDEFTRLAEQYSNFHYVVTLSRPPAEWSGPRGYVQDRVREILAEHNEVADAYICGLNLMVSANRQQLKEHGWEKQRVIYERYD